MFALSLVALVASASPAPSRDAFVATLVEVPSFTRELRPALKRSDQVRADAVYADASGTTVEVVALWDEGLPTPLNINPKTGDFASCKEARVAEQRVLVCPKPDGAHHSAVIWVRPGAQFTVAIYKPSSVPEKAAAELVMRVAAPVVAASVKQFP